MSGGTQQPLSFAHVSAPHREIKLPSVVEDLEGEERFRLKGLEV